MCLVKQSIHKRKIKIKAYLKSMPKIMVDTHFAKHFYIPWCNNIDFLPEIFFDLRDFTHLCARKSFSYE